jgi:hypothetical protein
MVADTDMQVRIGAGIRFRLDFGSRVFFSFLGILCDYLPESLQTKLKEAYPFELFAPLAYFF